MTDRELAGPHGRLGHVMATRAGSAAAAATADPEAPMRIEHREALIYTLGKAAELEHLVMCQYLYAAFSLKEEAKEGVPGGAAADRRGWKRELIHIGEQEMLHLALVQNLLASVGAAPRLGRPNFPLPPQAMPAKVQMALHAVRRGGAAPLRLPGAARGHGHGRSRGLRRHGQGPRAAA